MQNQARVTVNVPEFTKTLQEYGRYSKKTWAEIVNRKLAIIIATATNLVKRADKAAIEALGLVAIKLRKNRKTGKLGKGANVYGKQTRARQIVVANRRKAGTLEGASGKEIDREAQKLPSNRLKAVGYLAATLMFAVRDFAKAGYRARTAKGLRASGPRKSKGHPETRESQFSEASAEIFPVALKDATARDHIESAVAQAFRREEASMRAYIEKKMREDAAKRGIKLR